MNLLIVPSRTASRFNRCPDRRFHKTQVFRSRHYQETLIPVLLPVLLPALVPVQDLPQSQPVARKPPNPLISFFWRRSLSYWVISGRRDIGRTAKLRCGRKTVVSQSYFWLICSSSDSTSQSVSAIDSEPKYSTDRYQILQH
jgi:hypothetical protein